MNTIEGHEFSDEEVIDCEVDADTGDVIIELDRGVSQILLTEKDVIALAEHYELLPHK